jgi:hypothetical protein
MAKNLTGSSVPGIDTVVLTAGDHDLLTESIELGNQNKQTLGFLPHEGYRQACANEVFPAT